jgi:hypothetical protein
LRSSNADVSAARRAPRNWFQLAFALALIFCATTRASAQLVPNDKWYTIETEHFRVHFIKALEPEARRGAINAERAFAQLSTELKPPAGKVDLVIADNVDYVQGYATSIPSNRIVVFAHPPIDTPELRNYDDWSQLVITHELTHIFHLDRADGLWGFGRKIFGRHPSLFPNAYLPSWLIEGLAVYYESRITGSGRLEGAEHYMFARAAAQAHRLPNLDQVSLATSRFPGGESVYIYGSLIFDYLSRTRGPEAVPKFVDITSRAIFPLSLNAKAKKAFGISFENAFRDWSDSMTRNAPRESDPLPGWRELTHLGRSAEAPRWAGDSLLMYTAANGREVPGLYSVDMSGKVTRLGRRNGLDANVLLPNGDILFSQPDYTDAFHYRNDLYLSHEGSETQLTHAERLAQPDARRDGQIVASQSMPGTTRLVRVSPDGKIITPITAGSAEVQWADPRWSPDGHAIAAVRVRRGGINDLVILDTLGAVTRVLISERAIVSDPSWASTGDRVFYTSTRTGVSQGYVAMLSGGDGLLQLSRSSTGLFDLESSPGARQFAAVHFRYDGYHIGVAPVSSAFTPADTSIAHQRAACTNCSLAAHVDAPIALSDLPATRSYSPWQSLAPKYWEPVITIDKNAGNFFGAATSGSDVIGRHAYYVEAGYNTKYREPGIFGAYQYAGFGQPFINVSAEQTFDHFALQNSANGIVGDLSRRARIYGLSTSFVRPRTRTYGSLAFGGELESRDYTTDPDTLLAKLPAIYSTTINYPSLYASGSWTNAKRPALSISREDGISLSTTLRRRWRSGSESNASNSVVGVLAAYKSLDLSGFAHHAIALRAAGAFADRNAISTFSAGGLSGGSLDVFSGFALGSERRTFGVRGFPPSAEQGIRALGGTAEFRSPISAPSKRVPFIPVLFDRISVAAFGDAGRAWCPPSASQSTGVCNGSTESQPWLASVGAEADFDTAVQYDVPARFRAGIAVPVLNRAAGNAKTASFYLTVGTSF